MKLEEAWRFSVGVGGAQQSSAKPKGALRSSAELGGIRWSVMKCGGARLRLDELEELGGSSLAAFALTLPFV